MLKLWCIFSILKNEDLLILGVLLSSLYCKNRKATISYFYHKNIANLTAEPTFPSWYKRVHTNCYSKLCIREKMQQKKWKGI